jgi:hypothetical protein
LDEAVYEVSWQDAPPIGDIMARLRQFLQANEVKLTRVREKKTQQINARALVYDIHLLPNGSDRITFQITVSVGPQGSLRPEEVLLALDYHPDPGAVRVHRIALRQSAWRAPVYRGRRTVPWSNPD